MLFGLDMLKRHQCVLDLKQGVLRMGSGNVTVPFLSEGVRGSAI
jgi:DNA damage-inducible protein 1